MVWLVNFICQNFRHNYLGFDCCRQRRLRWYGWRVSSIRISVKSIWVPNFAGNGGTDAMAGKFYLPEFPSNLSWFRLLPATETQQTTEII
jgi:hypothetical protein